MEKNKSTYESVKNSLPAGLQDAFDLLVEDYKFAAHVRYGKKFVSYEVLGDIIKAGWRRIEKEIS